MLFPRIECPIGLTVLCVQTIARVNILLDFHRWRETWKGGKKNRIFRWISMKILKSSRQRDWEWFRRMGRLWPFAFGNSQCSPEMGRPVFPANSHYPLPPPPPLEQKQICQSNFTRDCLPPAAATSASEWKWPTCVSLCELFQALKGNNENTKANVKGCMAGRPVFHFLIVRQFHTRTVVRKVIIWTINVRQSDQAIERGWLSVIAR